MLMKRQRQEMKLPTAMIETTAMVAMTAMLVVAMTIAFDAEIMETTEIA